MEEANIIKIIYIQTIKQKSFRNIYVNVMRDFVVLSIILKSKTGYENIMTYNN